MQGYSFRVCFFFFSSRRRHTRYWRDWSSDVCSSDLDRVRARVDELLELIGLPAHEVRDRYPGQLSGGQRQRVGVARALAADPPVLLMDEPFGAIDPINRERLQNEFLRLQASIRKTIVFVTHDIDEAIKMGDKIAVLKKGGHLAQYAAPADLLMRPADKFVEDFVGADRSLKRLAATAVLLAPRAQTDARTVIGTLAIPAHLLARALPRLPAQGHRRHQEARPGRARPLRPVLRRQLLERALLGEQDVEER